MKAAPSGAPKDPCPFYAAGACKYGGNCAKHHHPNLDPALFIMPGKSEFVVPAEQNAACSRCLELGRDASFVHTTAFIRDANEIQCDKKRRNPGKEDPCEECRWFGGEGCNCVLAKNTSYNDALWRVMMTRRTYEYNLPAAKGRNVPTAKGLPSPM